MSRRYPHGTGWVEALTEVDLRVERSTIQGIIGFSGAGKSTLLRCIGGLEIPDRGRVLLDGVQMAGLRGAALRNARRKIGVVFQQLHLLHSRTVRGNVALPLELAGWDRQAIEGRVQELLHWFGLEDKAASHAGQLSGGQRQRVAVARSLALRPAVLLTDEPTSALDAETSASVLDLLRRVRNELGVTVVLVTHALEAVRAICDRVSVLDAGRIVEEGPVQEVLLQPQSPAARRLLNAESGSGAAIQTGSGRDSRARVLELQFIGLPASEPILTGMIRRHNITVNILRGRIDQIRGQSYGFLLVELSGSDTALEQSLRFLSEHEVGVREPDVEVARS